MNCGVGHRRSSDLALLWLWCRWQLQIGLDPSLGTSICHGVALENKNKQTKEPSPSSIQRGIQELPTAPTQTHRDNSAALSYHPLDIQGTLNCLRLWVSDARS